MSEASSRTDKPLLLGDGVLRKCRYYVYLHSTGEVAERLKAAVC
jgi:hypothetical protein